MSSSSPGNTCGDTGISISEPFDESGPQEWVLLQVRSSMCRANIFPCAIASRVGQATTHTSLFFLFAPKGLHIPQRCWPIALGDKCDSRSTLGVQKGEIWWPPSGHTHRTASAQQISEFFRHSTGRQVKWAPRKLAFETSEDPTCEVACISQSPQVHDNDQGQGFLTGSPRGLRCRPSYAPLGLMWWRVVMFASAFHKSAQLRHHVKVFHWAVNLLTDGMCQSFWVAKRLKNMSQHACIVNRE